MKLTPWIAAFWGFVAAGVGAGEIASHESASHWVSLLNTTLITVGGTVAILYQRRLDLEAKRREMLRVEHAKDLAAGLASSQQQTQADSADLRERLSELHERLTAVIHQRDEGAAERSELLRHILQLEDRQMACRDTLERVRCLHPGEPGHRGGPEALGE